MRSDDSDDPAAPLLPYRVPTSTTKLDRIAWLSIALGALSALVAFGGLAESDADAGIGVAGAIFFGGGGLWLKRALSSFTHAFEATEAGLIVHSQYATVGPIPWDEIREIRLDTYRVKLVSLLSIGVVLQDARKTLARYGPVTRWSATVNDLMGGSALVVPTMSLAAPRHEVLDRLRAILQAKTGRAPGADRTTRVPVPDL